MRQLATTSQHAKQSRRLLALVAERFGVEYHERTIGNLLKDMGFSRINALARPPKQDGEAIQVFKKTSRVRSKSMLAG